MSQALLKCARGVALWQDGRLWWLAEPCAAPPEPARLARALWAEALPHRDRLARYLGSRPPIAVDPGLVSKLCRAARRAGAARPEILERPALERSAPPRLHLTGLCPELDRHLDRLVHRLELLYGPETARRIAGVLLSDDAKRSGRDRLARLLELARGAPPESWEERRAVGELMKSPARAFVGWMTPFSGRRLVSLGTLRRKSGEARSPVEALEVMAALWAERSGERRPGASDPVWVERLAVCLCQPQLELQLPRVRLVPALQSLRAAIAGLPPERVAAVWDQLTALKPEQLEEAGCLLASRLPTRLVVRALRLDAMDASSLPPRSAERYLRLRAAVRGTEMEHEVRAELWSSQPLLWLRLLVRARTPKALGAVPYFRQAVEAWERRTAHGDPLQQYLNHRREAGRGETLSNRLRKALDEGHLKAAERRLKASLPRVRQESYRALQLRLARREVERLLGCPVPSLKSELLNLLRVAVHDRNELATLRALLRRLLLNQEPPANQRWLASAESRGLRVRRWLRGFRAEIEVEGQTITFATEKDPLEAVRLGEYFGTCLSFDGINGLSAACNVLDVNKQVIYGRNRRGRVVVRKLIAATADGRLAGYHHYGLEAAREPLSGALVRFALQCGLVPSDRAEPEELHEGWYDDGNLGWDYLPPDADSPGALRWLAREHEGERSAPALYQLLKRRLPGAPRHIHWTQTPALELLVVQGDLSWQASVHTDASRLLSQNLPWNARTVSKIMRSFRRRRLWWCTNPSPALALLGVGELLALLECPFEKNAPASVEDWADLVTVASLREGRQRPLARALARGGPLVRRVVLEVASRIELPLLEARLVSMARRGPQAEAAALALAGCGVPKVAVLSEELADPWRAGLYLALVAEPSPEVALRIARASLDRYLFERQHAGSGLCQLAEALRHLDPGQQEEVLSGIPDDIAFENPIPVVTWKTELLASLCRVRPTEVLPLAERWAPERLPQLRLHL